MKAFEEGMVDLESYIDELVVKIESTSKYDKMDFSRYPISNDMNHFYVDRLENVEVDLENFIRQFEIINDRLGSIAERFYDASGDDDDAGANKEI